jgi:integrase
VTPSEAYLMSLAPSTRRVMAADLRTIAALSGSPDPWRLTPDQATAVRAALAARYAPGTANRMLSALRGSVRAAWRAGELAWDVQLRTLASLPGVRGGRVSRGRSLSWGELSSLLEATGSAEERALLALVAGAGLRRAEVGPLTWDHLTRARDGSYRLRVLGKGNKERLLRLPAWTADALRQHRAAQRVNAGPTHIVRWRSPSSVREVLERAARRAGLGHVSPHDLRRTFFGLCRKAGLDLATIRRSMGHASIVTTVKYDRRADEEVQGEMEALDDPARLTPATSAGSRGSPGTCETHRRDRPRRAPTDRPGRRSRRRPAPGTAGYRSRRAPTRR